MQVKPYAWFRLLGAQITIGVLLAIVATVVVGMPLAHTQPLLTTPAPTPSAQDDPTGPTDATPRKREPFRVKGSESKKATKEDLYYSTADGMIFRSTLSMVIVRETPRSLAC